MRQSIKGLDYTTRDYEGFRTLMLDKLTELMPEYTDKRQSDAGIVILELNAMCLDILSYYLDSVANECFLATAEQRSSVMKFCKMLGYTPRFATSARYNQIFIKSDPTRALTIPRGTKVKTSSTNPNNVVYFTTTQELVLEANVRGDEQDENGNYLHTVEVIQGLYVNSELLDDNAPDQPNLRYSLKYTPVLIDDRYFSVYVSNIAQNTDSPKWDRVTTFAGSDSSSKVFMIENNDYNETSVVFGDGSFGLIPSNSVITCSYIVGGGDRGNVGIGSIKELEDSIAGVAETRNVALISVGTEAETVDEIRLNAPVAHRSIWGALTTDDFSGVVKTYFATVFDSESAKASEDWSSLAVDDIKIYILTKEEINYAKENDLAVIPESWYTDNTDFTALANSITDFFNSNTDYVEIEGMKYDSARKLAGTRNIIVNHSRFKELSIKYSLLTYDYYSAEDVATQIDSYIENFFSIGSLKYGQDISLKDIMYDILYKSGIEGIRYLDIKLDNITLDESGKYEDSYFTYVNEDLLIPKKGTIFAVTSITHSEPNI